MLCGNSYWDWVLSLLIYPGLHGYQLVPKPVSEWVKEKLCTKYIHWTTFLVNCCACDFVRESVHMSSIYDVLLNVILLKYRWTYLHANVPEQDLVLQTNLSLLCVGAQFLLKSIFHLIKLLMNFTSLTRLYFLYSLKCVNLSNELVSLFVLVYLISEVTSMYPPPFSLWKPMAVVFQMGSLF